MSFTPEDYYETLGILSKLGPSHFRKQNEPLLLLLLILERIEGSITRCGIWVTGVPQSYPLSVFLNLALSTPYAFCSTLLKKFYLK